MSTLTVVPYGVQHELTYQGDLPAWAEDDIRHRIERFLEKHTGYDAGSTRVEVTEQTNYGKIKVGDTYVVQSVEGGVESKKHPDTLTVAVDGNHVTIKAERVEKVSPHTVEELLNDLTLRTKHVKDEVVEFGDEQERHTYRIALIKWGTDRGSTLVGFDHSDDDTTAFEGHCYGTSEDSTCHGIYESDDAFHRLLREL